MPDQSQQLEALHGSHSARLYVSVMTGSPIARGVITETPEQPAIDLTCAFSEGDPAAIAAGMQIAITASGGSYKGTLTVRHGAAVSGSTLPVREFSAGSVPISAGDRFTLYDDIVLTDRLVADDPTFAPDHEAYVDQGSKPPPVACSGGSWAGWIGAGGYVDVPFCGSPSYAVDPDSSGALIHAWSAPGGVFVGGDAASADPVIRYSAAGRYRVTHTVTDATSGKSAIQHLRVRVHSADDPPYECLVSAVEGDTRSGFSAAFRLFERATLADIPDGAAAILWTREAGTGSVTPGRSHVVCAGFLKRDTARGNADGDDAAFELQSPLARLAALPGFSKVMLREASPDAWDEIRGLTVKRAIIQLLGCYTNVLSLCDLVFEGFADAGYAAFFVQKANPLEQARALAESRDARIVCDRAGRLAVQRRLELTPLDERESITIAICLNADDVIDYVVTREHERPVETVRVRGYTAGADANDPVYARFPASPGTGNASLRVERLIVDDADDLYERCALRGAWADRVLIGSDGVQQHAPEARLTLFGGYAHVFQFYREFTRIEGVTTLRGVDLAGRRWIPQRISVHYAGGTATTTLILRAETGAPPDAAVDDSPPVEAVIEPLPPVTLPRITSEPDHRLTGIGRGANRIAVFSTDGHVYISDNFLASRPTWKRYPLAVEGTVTGFVVDAYSPLYLRAGKTVNGWIVTTAALYRIGDIFGVGDQPRRLDLRHTFAYPPVEGGRTIEASFGAPTRVCVASYYKATAGHSGTWVLATTNDVNYSEVQVTPHYQTFAGLGNDPALHVSSLLPGRVLVGAFTNTASDVNAKAAVYESLDGGLTWHAASAPAAAMQLAAGQCFHAPFHDNPGESILYWTRYGANSSDIQQWRSSGAGQANISPAGGYGARVQRGIVSHPLNRRRMVLAGGGFSGSNVFGAFTSHDGGETWTRALADMPAASAYSRANFAGDDPSVVYLWGTGGRIGYSADFCKRVQDKRGNITTMSGVGSFVNLCGG